MPPADMVVIAVDGKPTAGQTAAASVARITGLGWDDRSTAGASGRLDAPRDADADAARHLRALTTSHLINDHGTKVGYVSLIAFATGAGARVHAAVDPTASDRTP